MAGKQEIEKNEPGHEERKSEYRSTINLADKNPKSETISKSKCSNI
jgi:hypothetical protein